MLVSREAANKKGVYEDIIDNYLKQKEVTQLRDQELFGGQTSSLDTSLKHLRRDAGG